MNKKFPGDDGKSHKCRNCAEYDGEYRAPGPEGEWRMSSGSRTVASSPLSMPEAFVVLAVIAVTLLAWFGAWMQARNPASLNRVEESHRLRQHAAWLAQ